MDELIENQCPNCSATIKFDSKLKIMKCPYCDSKFRVSGTTVQDEVVDEVHPNYEKMYYAVFVDNLCTGLIIIALIIWIIELILGLTHVLLREKILQFFSQIHQTILPSPLLHLYKSNKINVK